MRKPWWIALLAAATDRPRCSPAAEATTTNDDKTTHGHHHGAARSQTLDGEARPSTRSTRPTRSIDKAGRVTFDVRNDGKIVHALEIEAPSGEAETGNIDPGQSKHGDRGPEQGRQLRVVLPDRQPQGPRHGGRDHESPAVGPPRPRVAVRRPPRPPRTETTTNGDRWRHDRRQRGRQQRLGGLRRVRQRRRRIPRAGTPRWLGACRLRTRLSLKAVAEVDLNVVCKHCGAEVSPYITECPYCGQRLRKRAPKLRQEGEEIGAVEPRRRRRRRRAARATATSSRSPGCGRASLRHDRAGPRRRRRSTSSCGPAP